MPPSTYKVIGLVFLILERPDDDQVQNVHDSNRAPLRTLDDLTCNRRYHLLPILRWFI